MSKAEDTVSLWVGLVLLVFLVPCGIKECNDEKRFEVECRARGGEPIRYRTSRYGHEMHCAAPGSFIHVPEEP